MPNNCLSVLYKHIIQVENENVGLKASYASELYLAFCVSVNMFYSYFAVSDFCLFVVVCCLLFMDAG